MKFFFKIKKKWLQHRVYKYTLKYEGSMSKSKYYADMSNRYNESAKDAASYYIKGKGLPNYVKASRLSLKSKLRSDKYKSLANIYLDKKIDLEEELQNLRYPKA